MKNWVKKLQEFMQRMRDEKGVTLIELLAVVVILAIIAAVAVPIVINQINISRTKTDKANEQIIVDALQRAEFDFQSQNSGSLFISRTGTIGITAAGTTQITPGTGTREALYTLLTSGVNSSGPYLQSIPSPNTGKNWTISSVDPSTSGTNGTSTLSSDQPESSFTLPTNSTGTTATYYIYPSN